MVILKALTVVQALSIFSEVIRLPNSRGSEGSLICRFTDGEAGA